MHYDQCYFYINFFCFPCYLKNLYFLDIFSTRNEGFFVAEKWIIMLYDLETNRELIL